jgi:hypothetical protein
MHIPHFHASPANMQQCMDICYISTAALSISLTVPVDFFQQLQSSERQQLMEAMILANICPTTFPQQEPTCACTL